MLRVRRRQTHVLFFRLMAIKMQLLLLYSLYQLPCHTLLLLLELCQNLSLIDLPRLFLFSDAGDKALFVTLEQSLIQGMPADSTEWKRSYSRPVKSVFTEATFVPFERNQLPKEGDWHLIRQPIFHIYWTECVVCISSSKRLFFY